MLKAGNDRKSSNAVVVPIPATKFGSWPATTNPRQPPADPILFFASQCLPLTYLSFYLCLLSSSHLLPGFALSSITCNPSHIAGCPSHARPPSQASRSPISTCIGT